MRAECGETSAGKPVRRNRAESEFHGDSSLFMLLLILHTFLSTRFVFALRSDFSPLSALIFHRSPLSALRTDFSSLSALRTPH